MPTQVERASSRGLQFPADEDIALVTEWSGGGSRAGGCEDESNGAQADDSVERGNPRQE
jgi:hypothetical protein